MNANGAPLHIDAAELAAAALADTRPLPTGTPEEIARALAARAVPLDDAEPEAPKRPASLVDRVDALFARPKRHLATGLPTLDTATRGGVEVPGIVVVQGAPNAGKTTLAIQWAELWARMRHAVVILASDELMADVVTRLGQLANVPLAALEACEPWAVAALKEALRDLPGLQVLDGGGEDGGDPARVEHAAAEALALARDLGGDALPIVILDSVQTVPADGSATARDPRARIDAVLAAMKRARSRGCLVVATSEVGRAFYRGGKPGERPDAMAAGKESGGIEYGAALTLVLSSVKGEHGTADVECPKIKRGTVPSVKFRLSPVRPGRPELHEVPSPDCPESGDGGGESAEERRAKDLAPRVLAGIVKRPGIAPSLLREEFSLGRRDTVFAAVRLLLEAGEIREERRGNARRLYRVDVASQAQGEADV